MKICTKCGKEFNESMFTKDKTVSDGRRCTCKNCCKEYRLASKDRIKEYSKQYGKLNREKCNIQCKIYYENNKQLIYQRYKEKTKQNISFKLNTNVHKCINSLFTGRSKTTMYTMYLGYNEEQLKKHFELLFTPEMNWDNYGSVWEIDHIIPKNCFSFESYDDEQFKQCWSLSNIRPILKSDNRSRPKDGSDVPNEIKQQILKGVYNVT